MLFLNKMQRMTLIQKPINDNQSDHILETCRVLNYRADWKKDEEGQNFIAREIKNLRFNSVKWIMKNKEIMGQFPEVKQTLRVLNLNNMSTNK